MWYRYLYGFLILLVAAPMMAQSPAGEDTTYGTNYFLIKPPFQIKDSFVTFFLRGHTDAGKVIVTGNFTNWSTTELAMTRTDKGWIADIKLSPGRYSYKFIIDGNWSIDLDNKQSEILPQGYINSVYYKTNHLFELPGFKNAKSVFLAGSFNNWREKELKMQHSKNGWMLPLYLKNGTYLYRFTVDGKGYADPATDYVLNKYSELSSYVLIGPPDEKYKGLRSTKKIPVQDSLLIQKNLANKYFVNGNFYLEQADYPNALASFRKTLNIYQALKIPDSIGSAFLKVALVLRLQSDFPSELENLLQAIRLFEQTGNTPYLAEAYRRVGNHNINLGKWKDAFEAYKKANGYYEKLNDKESVIDMLGQMAHSCGFYDKEKSLGYIYRAIKLSEEAGYEPGLPSCYWLLGYHYIEDVKDTLTGINYFKKAGELYTKYSLKNGMAEILLVYSRLYIYASDSILKELSVRPEERFGKAISNEKKALVLYDTNRGRNQVITHFLSETFEKAGEYDSALVYYRRWVEGQNKFYNSERDRELARLQEAFKFEKIEDSLTVQNLLVQGKLNKQMLLALKQQQQLTLSNKEKELQRLEYLKSQADLKNEQLAIREKEKQLLLAEKEKQLQSEKVNVLTQKQSIAKLSQQRQWIYIAGIFTLLAFAFIYFIYRWRIRSLRLESQLVKEKSEQQQKEAEFQHKLADISLSALRSQMNPHFIFNCLNSIKLYTQQNDTAAASVYLTKFSKLIRLVLDNSRNERITLADEMAALELYIEMEVMRFKNKLSYSIKVEKDVETDYIEIPPLLLQPYVENAIWHGLMHKEEGGKIDIHVFLKNEGSLLEIDITDNGIGREGAAKLNHKRKRNHNSYGMRATSDRIALINQIYKTGANVTIHDLADHEGRPAGTRVVIQLPI